MSNVEWLEKLKRMSNSERLEVIEAATRLVREDLAPSVELNRGEDPILRVLGSLGGDPLSAPMIEEELYGPGAR